MEGIGENSLQSMLSSLTTSLSDYGKFGDFASLGISAWDIKQKDPIEGLFEVLKKIQASPLQEGMKREYASSIGIDFDSIRGILKQGSGGIDTLEKRYKEGLGIYGKGEQNGLQGGEKSMIRFSAELEKMSMRIGARVAPFLTLILRFIFNKSYVCLFKNTEIYNIQNMLNIISRKYNRFLSAHKMMSVILID